MDIQDIIKGIHHVTATVSDAQEDVDFYTRLLGLRLVKKTVNFDNNQVYHFYYGNEIGEPSTIMTTFPYKGKGVRDGVIGTGQVSITGFSAPTSSIPFWKNRLETAGINVLEGKEGKKINEFGNPVLHFKDPSGLLLKIIGNDEDNRAPWKTNEIDESVAIRGFYNVTLLVSEGEPTFKFLTDVFGFDYVGDEENIRRYAADGGGAGKYVDIQLDPEAPRGVNGLGTVHHVAWRVDNDESLLAMRKYLTEGLGMKVTEVKDRKYFHSIYFRMPGHVLFEVATIPPGFLIDEEKAELGTHLMLPEWEEVNRTQIESVLPKLN